MYLRVDKLQVELPMAKDPDPAAAAAVQELLGGRFGEMSTLMNYTYQSFNFRGKKSMKPFYDLVANIATEELGHIEVVSATINGLLNGATEESDDYDSSPLKAVLGWPNLHHGLNAGAGAMAVNSMNQPWQGDYIFNTGDLVLDMLHNFFLECGARMGKLRVYETTDNPIARQMCGYLLTRGGVHQVAYAKALKELTGVEVEKMLDVPKIPNADIPEAKKFHDEGVHRILYRFSPEDYKDLDKIWKGTHPADGSQVEVQDGPPEGGPVNDLEDPAPELSSPGYHPEELKEIAKKLLDSA